MVGKEREEHKLVVSRFPADSAILAEEDKATLNVEFLERVFMKSATSYKSAVYQHSDFRTTSAAGTKRLAIALRDAIRRSDDVTVKSEIAAAVTLAGGLAGKTTSIREFGEQLGLSSAAKAVIAKQVRESSLRDEKFRFSFVDFSNEIAYRSVELDTGGVLTAETNEFDKVFKTEAVDDERKIVRFSTEGKIVGEKFAKSKPT